MLAGMLLPRHILANIPPLKNIGLQMYSLREEIKSDMEGSLKKISEIGYKTLEAAGYENGKFYGMDPLEFKALVEGFGMKVSGSHVTFNKENAGTVLSAHKAAGIKYLVWPSLNAEQRKSPDSYKEVAEKFNTIGQMCKDNGLEFGYHNHDFEFNPIDGVIPYELLLDHTDPDLVFMEIDLYWITYAGKDPVEYFKKYPGRFRLWHVKDMAPGKEKSMTEVGSGVINYQILFEYASLSGMKEFFVEQDDIIGDGFESVKKSFNFLSHMH